MGVVAKPASAANKSFDVEKVAASAITSPLAAAALANQVLADEALAMTGEHFHESGGKEDAFAQIMSSEDLAAAAIEDYSQAFALMDTAEPLLLAQANKNVDAGGGLVQEEEGGEEGGAGWGWGLGLLGLGLAAGGGGGGGGGGDINFYYPVSSSSGTRVKWNSGITANAQQGYDNLTVVTLSAGTDRITIDIDGPSVNFGLDDDGKPFDASAGKFEYYVGTVVNGSFFAASAPGDTRDAILISYDKENLGTNDYGFAVTGFQLGITALTIELLKFSVTNNAGSISILSV